jgi:hypothetical protein
MELVMTMHEAAGICVNNYIYRYLSEDTKVTKVRGYVSLFSDEIRTKDVPNHEC